MQKGATNQRNTTTAFFDQGPYSSRLLVGMAQNLRTRMMIILCQQTKAWFVLPDEKGYRPAGDENDAMHFRTLSFNLFITTSWAALFNPSSSTALHTDQTRSLLIDPLKRHFTTLLKETVDQLWRHATYINWDWRGSKSNREGLLWLVTCLPVILSVAKSCWERVFSRKEDWERRASLSIAIKE
jgi:hypothetical protein